MNRLRLLIVVGAVVAFISLGQILSPPELNIEKILLPPCLTHWLGTDGLGRDVGYRSFLALSYTLSNSILILSASIAIGILLASISSLFFGKWLDRGIVIIAETMRAYPTLLLVLLFASIGFPSTLLLIAYFWIPIWRVLRAELVAQQKQAYALAARLFGISRLRILICEVFPNIAPRVAPYAAGLLAEVIAAQCALEFLGFGPPIERPSLGGILLESTRFGMSAAWIWLPSLIVICAFVWIIAWASRRYRQEVRWVPLG